MKKKMHFKTWCLTARIIIIIIIIIIIKIIIIKIIIIIIIIIIRSKETPKDRLLFSEEGLEQNELSNAH